MRCNIMANATASAAWCTLGKPFIQLSSGWGYYVLILIATCGYSHWPLKQLSTFDESLCVGIRAKKKKTPACSHMKPIPRVNASALTPCTPDVTAPCFFFVFVGEEKSKLLLQQRAPWQEIWLSSQAPPDRINVNAAKFTAWFLAWAQQERAIHYSSSAASMHPEDSSRNTKCLLKIAESINIV